LGDEIRDNLARFGISSKIVDERPDQTSAGRADGLQPKTLETLRMLRLADDLIRVGTKVFDICIWGQGNDDKALRRLGREIHYPDDVVDVLDPYLVLCHQGMVEATFIKSMEERGVEVQRSTKFEDYQTAKDGTLRVRTQDRGSEKIISSRYLVGCKSPLPKSHSLHIRELTRARRRCTLKGTESDSWSRSRRELIGVGLGSA
jgi:phenol 2-monooxygenase